MYRTFGAPSGAFGGRYGVQSATESRMSSAILPLRPCVTAYPSGNEPTEGALYAQCSSRRAEGCVLHFQRSTARAVTGSLGLFDLQSQKATRLTPTKLFAWDGVWIDNDNVLFLSREPGEQEDSIYRMSVGEKM